jgi:heme exporter protein C
MEQTQVQPASRPASQTHTGPAFLFGALWLAAALAMLAVGFHRAIWVAPTEETMGNIQRIFYWHVPSAILALTFPYVNPFASLAYLFLRHRNPLAALTADAIALAAAEVTVVFASIGLATGMLWGRPVWGIWWTWDARLTSFLLLWLLYVAYLMTRRLSASGQTGTLGAVLAIFAGIDVPIVYFSIQWWRTQHPSPVLTGKGELDPAMRSVFNWNLLAWAMWGVFILCFRIALERRRQRAEQAATLLSLERSLADPGLTDTGEGVHPRYPEASSASF